jgi:hypothetical protein
MKKRNTPKEKMVEGVFIYLLGLTLGIIETVYFGSNFWPASYQELICDAMSFGISIIGAYIFLEAFIKYTHD